MAVAQLYYHLAPKQEVSTVVRALVRLLRSRREVQAIVLQNIASMTLKRRVSYMFGNYCLSLLRKTVNCYEKLWENVRA